MTNSELIQRAKLSDAGAFESLVQPELPKLRGVIRRMIGHPEDTEELVQDTLLTAYEKIGTFRQQSTFGTWLVAIGTRKALDHLEKKKRWDSDAQVKVREYLHSTPQLAAETFAIIDGPEHRFDAKEHIAFCFTCVGRSLEPAQQAALVLRDVLEYSGRDAAAAMGVSESLLRHKLSDARKQMQARFEGLCGLVNKDGLCHQCEGLRMRAGPGRDGPEIPELPTAPEAGYRARLPIVRDGDVDGGVSQVFHDFVWRAIERGEARKAG